MEFRMKAPFLPDVSTTNHLQNTKHNYLEKLTKVKSISELFLNFIILLIKNF